MTGLLRVDSCVGSRGQAPSARLRRAAVRWVCGPRAVHSDRWSAVDLDNVSRESTSPTVDQTICIIKLSQYRGVDFTA